MNTDAERITQLERAQAAQTAELTALREQVSFEKAERLALQTLTLPPLKQIREDVETARLRADFYDERISQLASGPRGDGADGELTADIAEIYRGLIALGKFQNETNARLNWLRGVVERAIDREHERLLASTA